MNNLPEWFTGEVFNKGEVVKHPITGKTYPLTATELSMYNFLTGSQTLTQIGIDPIEVLNNIKKADEWFKENNINAYNTLLK